MKTAFLLALAASMLAAFAAESQSTKPDRETRYLAFQIFTTYSSDPKDAQALANGMRVPLTPGTAALRDYVLDIKQRIGIIGDRQTRLAVMLGPLTFDQTDAEITQFIERSFDLALETDIAVGFHIDDCILWSGRKDLWSDPKNVEALDWDGTPCTGRQLNYSKTPMKVAPQMCFNSKAVQREVRLRAALIGKAIAAGVKKLEQLKRPEMFVGVISGWETQMGSDSKTGKYLGYRALLNRGFSRDHPPQDQALELEAVTQEFIDLWTTGLAEAGVPSQKIYSHIAFLSHRAFGMGDNKQITYMKPDKGAAYSQHNHYTPPSAAFGKGFRPGFSTYPQPGLFEDIYAELTLHKQVGWASSEGTNMQPGTGPGQTGMNMETYLAKMFNHGATLTTIFSWGIGGERMKNMNYRLCTEGEEELKAYRKFLRGEPLIEGVTVAGLQERLPIKVHKIQAEFPAWMQKADFDNKSKGMALMQKLQKQAKGRDPQALEQTADAILKLMGVSVEGAENNGKSTESPSTPMRGAQDITEEMRDKLAHNIGISFLLFRTKAQAELKVTQEQKEKLDQYLQTLLPEAMQALQKSKGERGKYNQKTHEEMAAVLKDILSEDQRPRVHQLELQKDGLFGADWNMRELQITADQQKQFVAPIQEMQKRSEALMEEIHKGANPDVMRPKALQLRLDLEVQLEALLTDTQKKQWKVMLGPLVDPSVLYGGVSSR